MTSTTVPTVRSHVDTCSSNILSLVSTMVSFVIVVSDGHSESEVVTCCYFQVTTQNMQYSATQQYNTINSKTSMTRTSMARLP